MPSAIAATFAMAALAGTQAGPDPADRAAIERGRQAITWAQNYACPQLGTPIAVATLASAADTQRVRAENWSYANSRLATMAEAIRARRAIEAEIARDGAKPSAGLRASFAKLDDSIAATSARTASAVTQWMLATWVEMSKLDGGIDLVGGKQNPLLPYAAEGRRLDELAAGFGGALNPLAGKYRDCLRTMQGSLIDYNTPQIRAAMETANTTASLERLAAIIQVIDPAPGSDASRVLADVIVKRDTIVRAAAEAEQRRRAAASASLRDRLAQEAAAGRSIATRYVNAIGSGNIDGAIQMLSDNVYLVSPQGNQRGKQAVAARMRDAAKEDQGVRPQAPQIDSEYHVYSVMRSNRGSGKMYFSFSGGKIDQIRLVQD